MNSWLYKLERKYGKFAIHNLTAIMLGFYVVGLVLDLMSEYSNVDITSYLTLNPYLVLHGQVWRLVSWLIVFPDSSTNLLFVLITLFFYFSIGRALEQAWGDFRYTVYILSGVLFSIIGAFILYGIAYAEYKSGMFVATSDGISYTLTAKEVFVGTYSFSNGTRTLYTPGCWFYSITTYYISMSLFLAYATTFPESRVMLYFIIPIKVKWLGYLYAAIMAFSMLESVLSGQFYEMVIMVMSLLNFLIFFFSTRDYKRISPMEAKRKRDYRNKVHFADMNSRQEAQHEGRTVFTRHKCAICGRTEMDSPNLQFRYCSQCDGNYEYCEEHLYTHEHVKRV